MQIFVETHKGDETGKQEIMADEFAGQLLTQLKELQSSLLVLNARMAALSVDRLMRHMAGMSYADFADAMSHVDSRIGDELSLISLFVLEQEKAAYFEPTTPLFGPDVAAKFLSAVYEIDEAGKCLALSRPTASVFHLMRSIEFGVRATAKCLSIPDPINSRRSWGPMLNTIKNEMDRRNKATPPAWTNASDRNLFDEAHASLDAVRNTWRNATMHVENKYNEEEAEHIFVAVRGFMKKLASRMDEQGQPLA